MSINVYLKGEEEIRNLPGFKEELVSPRNQHSWKRYTIPSIALNFLDGRWYFVLSYLKDRIPDILAELVEEISFLDTFSISSIREEGIYCYKSAEAELNLHRSNSNYHVSIRGKNMEDITELYRGIRSGADWCRPEISYAGKQGGKSRQELEEEAATLRDENEIWRQKYQQVLTKTCDRERLEMLSSFFVRVCLFSEKRWPWCWRKSIKQLLPALSKNCRK